VLTQKIFHFDLKAHCTDFVVKNEWPSNLPDLNPLDCYVWGEMLTYFKAEDHSVAKKCAAADMG